MILFNTVQLQIVLKKLGRKLFQIVNELGTEGKQVKSPMCV